MKRIRLLGLALLAVFAMGAVVASSAMAELPEILPAPTPEKPLSFSSETTKAAVLETTKGGGKGTITCAKATTSKGSFTSANKGEVSITFQECKQETKNCTTKGDVAGTILLNNAAATLVDVLIAGVLDLGVLIQVNNLEFECGTLKDKVLGSVIGVVDNEKGALLKDLEKTKKYIVLWKGTKGEQEITECMSPKTSCEKANKLESELGVGVELAVEIADATLTPEKEVEIHF